MTKDSKYRRFVDSYTGPVTYHEPLSAYTSFGTGGEADLFIDVDTSARLAEAVGCAVECGIPYFLLGGGSNVLIGDRGYRGLIIRNSLRRMEVKDCEIHVGAGELLDKTVDFAAECSLTGLEFAAGIWGSIGGAIYGNAGAFGSCMADILLSAEVMDKRGEVRNEPNEYFRFSYRHSYLKETKEIVTQAVLELKSGTKSDIAARVADIRDTRCGKHPTTACSAGCFFKNIDDPTQLHGKLPAGRLLEEIGAKDIRVGGAAVYDRHANIIVNTGTATSKDIRQLADILKKKVKEKFNIVLVEEVISLGDF